MMIWLIHSQADPNQAEKKIEQSSFVLFKVVHLTGQIMVCTKKNAVSLYIKIFVFMKRVAVKYSPKYSPFRSLCYEILTHIIKYHIDDVDKQVI